MKKATVVLLVLLLGLGTLFPASAATLPIDFSGGSPVLLENIKGMEYEDPTIQCKIETGMYRDTQYWAATIKIADPSQLRTVSAGGFDTNMVMSGTGMAKRVNAVLAINGDYYCYDKAGYIVRQGVTYLEAANGKRDVLFIDDKGDFHVVRKAKAADMAAAVAEHTIVNCFTFGPALVLDGEIVTDNYALNIRYKEGAQRTGIAQIGPLEYLCVTTLGPGNGVSGLTIEEFSILLQSLGVQVAYNLDGGYSALMAFNGEKINAPELKKHREISDIIYFASAQEPAQ